MKKKLLSLLLVLILVVSVTVIMATAEETTPVVHEHCICGDWCDGRGDHDCESLEKITWTPFTLDVCETMSDGRLIIPTGNYYLAEDLKTDKAFVIAPDTEVSICLNGKTLESSARVFRVHGTLNIAECTNGTGKVLGTNGNNAPVFYVGAAGHVNHYRGILRASQDTKNYGGVGAIGNDATAGLIDTAASGSYTMYGGTLDASKVTLTKTSDGKQGSGGAVVIFGSDTAPCSFTQYGGTIKGAKSVAANGAAILAPSSATVKLLGGNIEKGVAKNLGDGVYVTKGCDLTIGGSARIDDIYIPGDHSFTTENLTGSVGLSAHVTNSGVLTTCTEAEAACFTSNVAGRNVVVTESEGTYQISLGGHNNHCVCGGNLTGVAAENHTCPETAPEWTALTAENIVRDAGITVASNRETDSAYNMFAQSGCYYLSESITLDKNFEIRPGQEITICLNGYTLSTNQNASIFRITGGKLNICDCTGAGTLKSTKTTTASLVYLLQGYSDTTEGVTFNLYGGKLTATGKSTDNGAGAIQISNNNTVAPTVMNMYGGTITGAQRKAGGAISMVNYLDAVLNIYGGTITGGTSDTTGGNIQCTSGTINMYGGTISGGTAGTSGGNIYVSAASASAGRIGALHIYGGTVTGGTATNQGGNIYVNSADGNTTAVVECLIQDAKITNGTAGTRGGNIYINRGRFEMNGGTVTGGTLTDAQCGADIGIGANTPMSAILDGKVTIGEIGAFGNAGDSFAWAIGENFSATKPIKVSAVNLDKVIKNVTPDLLASFEPASETAQLTIESGDIYLRSTDVHYACYCGGTYAEGGSVIGHTCNMVDNWVAVDSQFLANSNTTTETVNGTDAEGNPTTEEVTTVTGFGTPVEYANETLGGTYYHVPAGYYYLTEDITLEHGLRIEKDTAVYIDLNGHTITGSATNARPLFIQGNLRICDSSYDSTKENKAEQFQGGIISTRATNYNLCYVSGGGVLRIFGGNYTTTAESAERAIFGATGTIYVFDGYIKGVNATAGSSVFELHEGSADDGSVIIYRATIEAGSAKNGGIVTMGGAEETFVVNSGNLIGTAVTNEGGVIYASKGSVTINGGTISGGSAIRGGNIFIGANATLTVKGGEITGGSAIGAASGSNGGGGNIYAAGNVTIKGGTISGGTATRTQSSAQAYGGNIYMNGSAKKLTISGGTISGGSAVTGGNIFARGEFSMSDGEVKDGTATEAIAGNIRVEGEKGICNITGGTISGGVAVQQGGNIVVRNSANEVIISGAAISGGVSQSSQGGSIYLVGITNNVTMENTTITGGTSASRAGNLYITAANGAEDVVATLTNCTITNGTTGDRGGNIYIADVACTMNNCTVTGGSVVGTEENMIGADLYGANIATNTGNHATALTINGGTYGGYGENNLALTSVHVLSSDDPYTVTVTGAPVIDDLRLGTDRMLTVGELTEGANIGISRFEISGLVSEGAAQYADYFHATIEGVSVDTEGEDLILVSSIPYWAFDANSNIIAPANTIAEALAMENVSFVRMVADHVSTETINGDLYLDLFGHSLSGLTVNGNLYVIDIATNDYEENVAGSLNCTVSGAINDGKTVYTASADGNFKVSANYVMLPNEDGSYGFHRVSIAISHISLDAGNDALGFKATVSGDSAVQAAVTGFGFNMGIEDGIMKTYTVNGNHGDDGVFTLRLKGIMAANGGEMPIVGEAFILFGEETVTGAQAKTSMKDTIVAVNDAWDSYSADQQAAVKGLYDQYADTMAAWLGADNKIASVEAPAA